MTDRKQNGGFETVVAKSRALVVRAARPVTIQLARINTKGRALVHLIPEPTRIRLGRAGRRSAKGCIELFAGLTIVGLIVLALVYGRLSQGPISLAFLVEPIQKAINSQLKGMRFEIGDAVVRLAEDGVGVEFRLKRVSMLDAQDVVIAEAPLAAVHLSGSALWSGRIAAGAIDFIGPRILLHVRENQGLALAFTPTAAAATTGDGSTDAGVQPEAQGGDSLSKSTAPVMDATVPVNVEEVRPIALVPALNRLFSRLRDGRSASSFLNSFGIKNATVFLARDERVTQWRVPSLTVELVHRKNRSLIVGKANIGTASRVWELSFEAEQKYRKGRLSLRASVENVIPRELAKELPALASLKSWDLPVTAVLAAELSREGDILTAEGDIRLAQGLIYAPWNEKDPAMIDGGALRFSYSRADGRFEIAPSTLRWGQSQMTVVGDFRAGTQHSSGRNWTFKLHTTQLALAAEQFGLPAIPIDGLVVQGHFDTEQKALVLDEFRLSAADAFVTLKGKITDAPGSPAIEMTGEISEMPVAFVKLIWPKFAAPGAREWIGESVSSGRITGGVVNLSIPGGVLAELEREGDLPSSAVNVKVGFDGLRMRYIKGMPPLITGEATALLIGRRFVFNVPESRVELPGGQRVRLTSGQMVIGDLRPHVPDAEIHFRVEGTAAAAVELIDHQPLGYATAIGFKPDGLQGEVSGAFGLKFPLLQDLDYEHMSIRGRATVKNPRVAGLFENFGINGGAISFDVNEKAIHGHGEIKVNGVPVQVSWQRIFGAPEDRQPGLRLSAVLDEKARSQLGLEINHIIRGEAPVELSIQPKDGKRYVRFEANLTSCELFLINVATRKPPGQSAVLTFEVIQEEGSGRTVLSDFRVVGEDIAIFGSITLDRDKLPVAFNFPGFSPNLLTHMQVSGRRGSDNIWKIDAKGSTYDGRQFFRSLFSQGKLAEDQPNRHEPDWGLDIHAQIGTVIGYFDTTITNVTLEAKKHAGKILQLDMHGRLNGEAPLAARIERKPGEARQLVAEATDAGAAFRLVGLYSRMQGGEASLRVNLDGLGAADRIGTLYAWGFSVLGDQVVEEGLSGSDGTTGFRWQPRTKPGTVRRQQIQFDSMRIPFSVGHGQFILQDAVINGPLLGATMRGRIDLKRDQVSLAGTYVPLYGLNAAIGAVPILGELLTGRQGEGILGITFAVKGDIDNPQVLVNPVSMVAPGFLRQIFEFEQAPPRIIPREEKPPQAQSKASSLPPITR